MTSRVLCIFEESRTDKGRHGYAPFYAGLEPPAEVLEVGVQTGASLLAWRRIWPGCEVTGVDITLTAVRPEVFADPRIHLVKVDATKWGPSYPSHWDLIVDDGSHALADQIAVRNSLARWLAPGGTYVIEDVTGANLPHLLWPGWQTLATGPGFDDRLVWYRYGQ